MRKKSITRYILKDSNNKEYVFKDYKDAQIYSWIYHNDFPMYSIYKRIISIEEKLIETGINEEQEDNLIQAEYKRLSQ